MQHPRWAVHVNAEAWPGPGMPQAVSQSPSHVSSAGSKVQCVMGYTPQTVHK